LTYIELNDLQSHIFFKTEGAIKGHKWLTNPK